MNIAIVGCGFVADYYTTTLPNHPGLRLVGVHDRDIWAAKRFAAFHGARIFDTLDELLADPSIELVLNLTNPASHYAVSRACLESGRHVYSEKPLAMEIGEAEHLVALASERGLQIASAPSSVLGEAAQTARRAIDDGTLGEVRLAYAEMEDSMVFRENYHSWRSLSGAPWPAEDEFAVGCTLEHAGYYLTWLCEFFGPVEELTAFSAKLFPDKGTGQAPHEIANDFSVACLRFRSGAVARLTCGLAAPSDRSLHIVGTQGVLSVTDGWNARSPLYLRDPAGHWRPRAGILGKVLRRLERGRPLKHWFGKRVAVPRSEAVVPDTSSRMDFMRGPARLAEAIRDGSQPPLAGAFALHVTELSIVAQSAERFAMPYRPRSTF
ncbi:gfo/Idh/MocA family oxidoreductase [Aureimonas flava]|uniref:Gfo/Idh/MocA family oxidoreductase n=1 Tax=Aureimonas flava TaxID=2320271 RepID=A0A3A1WMW9_9HYPH|nr:Gfo/Idh/MocA family oxidoreductase [Aureimonas flava]RIY03237.1 gfo/Idh/MocA family oxidoreductase [Aureimonas flava]